MERQLQGTKEAYKDILRGLAQILLDAAESEDELMQLRERLNVQQPGVQQTSVKKNSPAMPF